VLWAVCAGLFFTQPSLAKGCLSASPTTIERKAASHAKTIHQAAYKYHLDHELIQAVIAVESCFNQHAVSPAGAEGLMQLMPATADRFGVSDSFNVKQNIFAGSRYLKWLLKRYSGNLKYAVAAYNAGEGRVDQYQGIPPYAETQKYVKNVLAIYARLAPSKAITPRNTIANGTVYYPYAKLKKVEAKKSRPLKSTQRLVYRRPKPKPPKALTEKPGRQGTAYMRRHAPHLFRQ